MSEPLISPNIVRRYMHLFSRSTRSTAKTSVRSTAHRSHHRNRQRTLDPPQTPTAEAILARTQLRTVRTSDESHETGGHTRSESAPAYANECTTEQRRCTHLVRVKPIGERAACIRRPDRGPNEHVILIAHAIGWQDAFGHVSIGGSPRYKRAKAIALCTLAK